MESDGSYTETLEEAGGVDELVLRINRANLGAIFGRNGCRIKIAQRMFGVKIVVQPVLTDSFSSLLTISGGTGLQRTQAKGHVEALQRDCPASSLLMDINEVGNLIGPYGLTIKQFSDRYKVFSHFEKNSSGQAELRFNGSEENVKCAMYAIQAILTERSKQTDDSSGGLGASACVPQLVGEQHLEDGHGDSAMAVLQAEQSEQTDDPPGGLGAWALIEEMESSFRINNPGRGRGSYRGSYHQHGVERNGSRSPGRRTPDSDSDLDSSSGRNGMLSAARTLPEVARKYTTLWTGALILQKCLFPAQFHLIDGDTDIVGLMKDEDGKHYLRIPYRYRLDLPKLEDVQKRISTSSSHAIFLGMPGSESSVQIDDDSVTMLPLRALVSYLKKNDSAGIMSLWNKQTKATGILCAFPPCKFSSDLLKRTCHNLTEEAFKEDHIVIVVIRGGDF